MAKASDHDIISDLPSHVGAEKIDYWIDAKDPKQFQENCNLFCTLLILYTELML